MEEKEDEMLEFKRDLINDMIDRLWDACREFKIRAIEENYYYGNGMLVPDTKEYKYIVEVCSKIKNRLEKIRRDLLKSLEK